MRVGRGDRHLQVMLYPAMDPTWSDSSMMLGCLPKMGRRSWHAYWPGPWLIRCSGKLGGPSSSLAACIGHVRPGGLLGPVRSQGKGTFCAMTWQGFGGPVPVMQAVKTVWSGMLLPGQMCHLSTVKKPQSLGPKHKCAAKAQVSSMPNNHVYLQHTAAPAAGQLAASVAASPALHTLQ